MSFGGIKSFVFARQASARSEFSARLAVKKTKLLILLRLETKGLLKSALTVTFANFRTLELKLMRPK